MPLEEGVNVVVDLKTSIESGDGTEPTRWQG